MGFTDIGDKGAREIKGDSQLSGLSIKKGGADITELGEVWWSRGINKD